MAIDATVSINIKRKKSGIERSTGRLIYIIFVTVKSIKQHQKNIKLREILFVLEADNIDLREVQCNKEVFVKEYIIDRKIAENFLNACIKEKITETEQLNKMMEQFVKEKRK